MKYSGPLFEEEVNRIITNALREDVGDGDHSSLACIPRTATGKARLLVKDEGVIAGVAFAKAVFHHVDPALSIEQLKEDGDHVSYGDEVFYVSGSSRSILMAERLVLNSMQRMSAIATKTNEFVKVLEGTKTQILDTRKTTPGIRLLEKWSVTIGGGVNHRYGLYDMIMLKDNHIDFAGGITKAIEKTVAYLNDSDKNLKIIVEARNLEEIEEILKSNKVYRILIDNFNFENTRKAVELIGDRCLTESSGGITLDTARAYAECGVDYISSGSLTHSVYNMDLSLKAMHD
ncbi:carboxylating nicotinate-nucleotide diphosphorylase [Nonlabens marinus]|uniref:Probable nicotinate-nucleotide pyrophosphorylase [carboxylating] n=1 Tax=Nonlabens marinus S1-08 TaxID=1454201 RepID=W8VWN4_9FLAO|nr:carboxylating nicotinate-nucleotide diphosphorylase [Nonlabens marinus]BAO56488.1 quinolinate phosphoribosyltransferase [Nonlabens marinus S1-08]